MLGALLCICLVAGCAMQGTDPFEKANRKVQTFNDTADRFVLKPITRGYKAVVPDVVERGVDNVFSNLADPFVALNQLLQGKPGRSLSDSGRFLVNSTLGIVGIFDVATTLGLAKHQEDFGQTLGVWGVGRGPYIVLPFWGPSNPRDGFGDLVGAYGYLPNYLEDTGARNASFALWIINQRAQLLEAERLITGDRYLFIRDAYLQRRDYLKKDGIVADPFLEDEF